MLLQRSGRADVVFGGQGLSKKQLLKARHRRNCGSVRFSATFDRRDCFFLLHFPGRASLHTVPLLPAVTALQRGVWKGAGQERLSYVTSTCRGANPVRLTQSLIRCHL